MNGISGNNIPWTIHKSGERMSSPPDLLPQDTRLSTYVDDEEQIVVRGDGAVWIRCEDGELRKVSPGVQMWLIGSLLAMADRHDRGIT